MAQGVDLVAAFEAFAFGGRLWCYYPYKRKPHDAEEYLETKADKIRYECEEYQKGCHIKRDRRIVDDCDLMNIWEILALVYFVLPFVLMYISSKI